MRRGLVKYSLAAGMLIIGLGLSSAEAFVIKPGLPEVGMDPAVIPAAMCGYSCRGGGRYIPGPPSVCEDRGLNFCGSSRDRGPPAVVIPIPRFFGGGPSRGDEYRGRGGGCRTITIERDDGSVRRIRRCD